MRYSNDYMSIRKMFWDGGSYNLDSEGIKHCLERALKDFTPRTDKRQQEEVSASVSLMLEKLKENGFLEKFERYFKRDGRRQQKEYDEWHHQQCLLFISTLTDHKIRNSVSYGKAQKIVNMTMKTIYCLNGADDYDSRGYFDFCHMALDSYIMDWFRAEVANWYNNNHKKRQQRIKISKEGGPLPKWSKLEFLENSEKLGFSTYDQNPDTRVVNSQYHYMFFVTYIREYFNSDANLYKDLTPFKAEFYIWLETQWEVAAQQLINQDLLNKLRENPTVSVNNKKIKKLCEDLFDQVSRLSNIY